MSRTVNHIISGSTCTAFSWQLRIAIVWKRKSISLETMGLWSNGHNFWILQHENVDHRTIGKVEQQQPTIFSMLREWQSSVAESSYNIARIGNSFN